MKRKSKGLYCLINPQVNKETLEKGLHLNSVPLFISSKDLYLCNSFELKREI